MPQLTNSTGWDVDNECPCNPTLLPSYGFLPYYAVGKSPWKLRPFPTKLRPFPSTNINRSEEHKISPYCMNLSFSNDIDPYLPPHSTAAATMLTRMPCYYVQYPFKLNHKIDNDANVVMLTMSCSLYQVIRWITLTYQCMQHAAQYASWSDRSRWVLWTTEASKIQAIT